MSKPARTAVAGVAATGALMALAAALAEPLGNGLQALAQHRLIAAESLVAAGIAAVTLGFAIGRSRSGAVQTEARTQAETAFLANMSHELRTPLNAVIGFAELILSEIHGPLGDRRYFDYIGHIRAGGQQLAAIVDAILDLSQLAAGQLGLELRRVEPQALVEECAQAVAAQAETAKVELTVRPSTAPQVAADPARLKQALTNLLSNAIKFTRPGGRVSIGATGQDDAVAFEVVDSGIGMTPDQVVVAMQPFRMIDGPMTRANSGIGLGLPLAERLVRLHGGELRIDSRPGCGTAVTAILPVNGSFQTRER